jgi:hypothetical protein
MTKDAKLIATALYVLRNARFDEEADAVKRLADDANRLRAALREIADCAPGDWTQVNEWAARALAKPPRRTP